MSQKSYFNLCGTLYLIPTPIGNMEDITFRALQLLREVDAIFSEDTRVTLQLLKHFDIQNKLISNHEHNEAENKQKLIDYLKDGKKVGLVTDRGTPVISDPGYGLVVHAIKEGYSVVGLPGPTALIPALIMSGLPPLPFTFFGFLNSKRSKRKKELEMMKSLSPTMIFYEAPHRLQETLEDMLTILGDRTICVAREISKKFEEVYRGNISSVLEETKDVKGEIVIVVDGNHEIVDYSKLSIIEHVGLYVKQGMDMKEAMKKVSKDRGISKSEVYRIYHNLDV